MATNFYHVGGSVPLDAPSYIKREADDLFYNYLKNGQYCYVLNSRQMGKSSLWAQTQKRLQEDNIDCASSHCLHLRIERFLLFDMLLEFLSETM